MSVLGIIGSGAIGSGVARLAVAGGWDVVIGNSRGPESLTDLVAELGPRAQATDPAQAASGADVVVLAVPLEARDQLPTEALAGRVVVDAMNYYPSRNVAVPELDDRSTTSSELVQLLLPHSKLVKALHNVDFVRLVACARPAGSPERSALPLAGDDTGARAVVTGLLHDLGYDTVDLGVLAEGWRAQPGTPVHVQPYYREAEGDDPGLRFFNGISQTVDAGRVAALCAAATRGAEPPYVGG